MPAIQNSQTTAFLPYMRDVSACEQALQELNLMWRLIDASAKMNCPGEAKTILSTLATTRSGFSALEQALVATLVREKVENVQTTIATKAHYVIDIVVHNLFERTADVGFLATDHELCRYVAGLDDDGEAVQQRLRQYRDKYTVYDDIVLLDLQGQVLVRIDTASAPARITDALLAQTLGSDTYVETFRASALQPRKDRALIYSRRMLHPDTGAAVGVLCLCFHFEQEMAGIFHSHRDVDNHSIMLLLDGSDQVIASSEPRWIDTGARVPSNRPGQAVMMPFCGRQYLVCTVASPGYQGYPGPSGWQGQVMIPVDIAFHASTAGATDQLAPDLAAGLLAHAHHFCPPLHDVMTGITAAANAIERIVWNGQLLTAGQRGAMQKLKSILDQISDTGTRSNAVFASAVQDLFQIVLAAGMREAEFTAHLLVDLLDRNLYERSDDCRWWAMTSALQAALTLPQRDAATLAQVQKILETINGLYTVYTRIFLYDRRGAIVACTGVGSADHVGSQVDAHTLASVLRLSTAQQYHVSAFDCTRLYDDAPTYVYHAAMRAVDDPHNVVGGIGIVFDATPELANMLRGGVDGRDNLHALYVDRHGRILSSTDVAHPVGTALMLDADLLQLDNGVSRTRITVCDGHYAILACSVSAGYREFKVSDGYCDDVIAVVIARIGAVGDAAARPAARLPALDTDNATDAAAEYGTFLCAGKLLAIRATNLHQALPHGAMSPASMSGPSGRIGLIRPDGGDGDAAFVWVFDLRQLIDGTATVVDDASQILLVEHEGQCVGLLVDALHAVPRFDAAQFIEMPFSQLGGGVLVTQVIKAADGELLIQLLDLERLFALLVERPPAVSAEANLESRAMA